MFYHFHLRVTPATVFAGPTKGNDARQRAVRASNGRNCGAAGRLVVRRGGPPLPCHHWTDRSRKFHERLVAIMIAREGREAPISPPNEDLCRQTDELH
jgi:hypothetical protein